MNIRTICTDRKAMAHALAEHLGTTAEYLRTPTYAFRVGGLQVERDGSITGERADLESVAEWLMENGYIQEPIPAEEPIAEEQPDEQAAENDSKAPIEETISHTCVSLPLAEFTSENLKNLIRILYTRQYLINRMFRMDMLYIDPEVIDLMNTVSLLCISDLEALVHDEVRIDMIRGFNIIGGTVAFDLPYETENSILWIYGSQLITAIIRQAKESRRTKAEKQEPANDKYMANAWLNRLGFGGADYKALRHALMAHLNGYAAFKDDDRMQKHKDKLARQRKIRREIDKEAHAHD